MKLFDTHVHTMYSHDSNAVPEEICEAALQNGVSGITLTDHADIAYMYEEHRIFQSIGASIEHAERLKKVYEGKLQVFSGFEISEGFWFPDRQEKLISAYGSRVDAILCSVHAANIPDYTLTTSVLPFDTYSDSFIRTYIRQYYTDMLTMLDTLDGDILCHITYPFRYIALKFGLTAYSPMQCRDLITEIFGRVIERDMALEVNTSNIGKYENAFFMPDRELLTLYRELGGKRITLGADAHIPGAVANHFDDALSMLASLGFTEYCYYEKRKPVSVKIELPA